MNRSCGSRQAVTTMVLTIAALSGLVSAEPGRHLGLNDLRRGFTEALERADYDKAIVIGTELMSRTPQSALDAYNLACAYALNGKKTNAAAWLKTSAENGWSRLQQTRADDDLVNIRNESGYHEALKRIEKNHDADFKIFKKKADAHEPVIITPPAYDPSKPAPLIVVLHGFGGRADPIAKTWEQAAAAVGACAGATACGSPGTACTTTRAFVASCSRANSCTDAGVTDR